MAYMQSIQSLVDMDFEIIVIMPRDCKIWSIWEGTNYIQSLDLIGRKWNQKKGKAFAESLQEIADWIAANKGNIPGFDREMAHLEKAFNAYKEIQKTMWGYMKDRETGLHGRLCRRVLTATAQYGAAGY